MQSAFVSVIISINRTSPCAADSNELEDFDVNDSWCCYVGNEELHVIVLYSRDFLLGLGFKGTYFLHEKYTTLVQK